MNEMRFTANDILSILRTINTDYVIITNDKQHEHLKNNGVTELFDYYNNDGIKTWVYFRNTRFDTNNRNWE